MPVVLSTFALLLLASLTDFFERSLLAHVLLLYPLLIWVGFTFGLGLRSFLDSKIDCLNAGGITGMLVATFTLAFWMIPRWLDASIDEQSLRHAKFASLPLLVGLPIALSWHRLHPIARAVVKIEFLTMLFRLGWLYIISPTRLCNNYLSTEQQLLGQSFIILGIVLSLIWLYPVFFSVKHRYKDRRRPEPESSF